MRVRALLVLSSIVSMAAGAVILYLVLTVPNDITAASLMKTARQQIAAGDNVHARQTLGRIVQQYPRTDAAAAAMVALASLSENEARSRRTEIDELRRKVDAQRKRIDDLDRRVGELASSPPPQPAVQPPPAPAPRKGTTRRH